jgi:hypothetical protein
VEGVEGEPGAAVAPIVRDGMVGFIDAAGSVAIEPRFDLVTSQTVFSEGVAAAAVGGSWGYVDRTGRLVIEPRFAEAQPFSEGLAFASGSEIGYIDRAGDFVIKWERRPDGRFDSGGAFSEGLAPVQSTILTRVVNPRPGGFPMKATHSWGYIDRSGEVVIPPRFDRAGPFSEGLAAVVLSAASPAKEARCGYIGHDGELFFTLPGRGCQSFSGGRAAVRLWEDVGEEDLPRERWGYVDRAGTMVIEPRFVPGFVGRTEAADWRFSEGLACVLLGDRAGFIDRSGELVIEARFERCKPFSGGLAAVVSGGRWGFIDEAGEMVISPQFDGTHGFVDGLAFVGVEGRFGYIDREGRRVWGF